MEERLDSRAENIARAAAALRLRPVRYRSRLVAVAAPERVYLAPEIARLTAGDPLLRFVAVMCLYCRDVDRGAVPAPYNDAAAELYARCVLIPDDEFARAHAEPDELLARRFGVPAEQIAAKRADRGARAQL